MDLAQAALRPPLFISVWSPPSSFVPIWWQGDFRFGLQLQSQIDIYVYPTADPMSSMYVSILMALLLPTLTPEEAIRITEARTGYPQDEFSFRFTLNYLD
jgi:hypothetical protein